MTIHIILAAYSVSSAPSRMGIESEAMLDIGFENALVKQLAKSPHSTPIPNMIERYV